MKRITMAAVLLLVALTANAQDEDAKNMRIGVAAAFSDYKGDSSFPVDDSGVGLQLYAQYQLNSWFAVEGGYYNSGDFETDLDPNGTDGNAQLGFSGFTLSAIGYLPIGSDDSDIDLYAKLGAFDFDIDLALSENGSKIPGSLGHTTGAVVGAGAIINVSDSLGIRAGFDWFDVNNADLWALSMGIDFRF
jgi:OOP family OmpA-OmpF porin